MTAASAVACNCGTRTVRPRRRVITALSGRVAIVTGAGRGIGSGIAKRLGKLGASVIVNDVNTGAANETASAIEDSGGRAVAMTGDIAKLDQIDQLFAAAVARFRKIDIVVANAGVQGNMPVLDVTEADYDRLFAVNSKGSYFTLQRAARHVVDHGRIIYVGSSTSRFPMAGHGLYGASKVSTTFLVEVLAKEIGHRGVTVNSILPIVTEGAGSHTDGLSPGAEEFIRHFNPMRRPGSVKDAADACEFLVSDLAGFVSGQHLLLSGGGPA